MDVFKYELDSEFSSNITFKPVNNIIKRKEISPPQIMKKRTTFKEAFLFLANLLCNNLCNNITTISREIN